MKQTIRSLSLLLALLALITAFPVSASAAAIDEGEGTVEPCWENTSSIAYRLAFIDGEGYAGANILAHLGASHISADLYVYRRVGARWTKVKEEHISVDDDAWGISCTFPLVVGGHYRAEYTIVVTKDGVDETITHSEIDIYTGE